MDMPRVLRTILAIVVGYAVMVILITLVQETWLGGVSYRESPRSVLALAGFFTFLSAGIGGLVAAWIGGRQYLAHGLAVAAGVVVETTVLLSTGGLSGPLWFDLLAALSLIIGILLGAVLFSRLKSKRTPQAAVQSSRRL